MSGELKLNGCLSEKKDLVNLLKLWHFLNSHLFGEDYSFDVDIEMTGKGLIAKLSFPSLDNFVGIREGCINTLDSTFSDSNYKLLSSELKGDECIRNYVLNGGNQQV